MKDVRGGGIMLTGLEEKDVIKVKQYVTDKKGRKVAAIIDIDELYRLEELIEEISDLKVIEERKDEPVEDYEAYSRRRKACRGV
ncbi:MAG: hypothetical protein FJ241_07720 [Nitrospira sp.]|nr:hypothetical protein [Nitrospira sp.]